MMNSSKCAIVDGFGVVRAFCLAIEVIISWAVASFSTFAQAGSELETGTYVGLTISGTVGTVYSVEYVTDLWQMNNPSAWRSLEYLKLPESPYRWADKSATASGKRFYRAVEMAGPTNMVFIPPGTFRMGSPTNEADRLESEGPQTDVIISRGFWIGTYEVTQGEYLAVMGNNPSVFQGIQEVWDEGCQCLTVTDYTDLTRPVESVSWEDGTNYCAVLTQRERAAGRIAINAVYRLPTEAEWEYACRGWTSTRFSYGDDPGYTNLTNYAWYGGNGGVPRPVGQKLPNPWGLYDMHGNVWEWCLDRWADNLPGGIVLDPQGSTEGLLRVRRGGSWDGGFGWVIPGGCRSAFRLAALPAYRSLSLGFRTVLASGQP